MRRALPFLAILFVALDAHAQSEDAARAQQLFEQGMAASKALDYATACPKFAASQKLDPRTSTLLNLASCYELNGQTASAWATFKEAQAAALRFKRAEWAERAAAAIASLEPRLVRITVHVPEAARTEGMSVTLDANPLTKGEWDQPVPVDPGKHVIEWAAPGHETQRRSVVVSTTSQDVTLTALSRTPESPAAGSSNAMTTPPSFWTGGRVAGVAIGGAGVATLATGAVFGLLASSRYDEAERLCGTPSGDPRVCLPARSVKALDARSAASDLAATSTVLFVAGGVLAAGGAALVLVSGPKKPPTVAVVPSGPGLAAIGRW